MDFANKIITKYEDEADKVLAFCCRIMMILMVLVALLNVFHIFKIEPGPLYSTVAVSLINFFLPTLFYNILKIRKNWIRYFILTLMVLQSGLLYAVLSYHTIIMLVFPVMLSCLYNRKKYVYFSMFLSVPVLVVSHLAAFALNIVPDEPLVTLKGVIFYGIFPRTIEFLAVSIVCLLVSSRIQELIRTLAEKNEDLYEDQETLIAALSEIIESKSQHTGYHVKRVAEYTGILCRGLGFSEEDTWKISTAAMMHDVGKIMIPSEIIEKPGKLTEAEFDEVKKHVEYGKKMLGNAPGEIMKISTEIAYQHHEKWDGKGYLGLSEEQINPYARCVAVADVFDALVTKRPYKKAWTPGEAYDEIVSQRGKHFAPEVVDVFVEHFNEFLGVLQKYPG